jgi:hypothetical protein
LLFGTCLVFSYFFPAVDAVPDSVFAVVVGNVCFREGCLVLVILVVRSAISPLLLFDDPATPPEIEFEFEPIEEAFVRWKFTMDKDGCEIEPSAILPGKNEEDSAADDDDDEIAKFSALGCVWVSDDARERDNADPEEEGNEDEDRCCCIVGV